MPDEMRILSRRGPAAALFALSAVGCASGGEPDLARDLRAASVANGGDAWSEAYIAPEYTEAVCQSDWPVTSVEGPECTARDTFTCEDAWTLEARLEAIVGSCGISPAEDALELSLSGGCVTGMAYGPNSRANEPAIRTCLVGALGSVQAACSDQPECIRLYGAVAPPGW